MKTLKRNALVIILIMIMTSAVFSQTSYTKKKAYPNWSLSPLGGITFPVGELSNNFDPGVSTGLDVTYRVNREVGFYGKFGYNTLGSKTTGLPDGKYLEYTVGPKYYFTSPNLKSSVYLEAGVGAYTFMQNGYMLNNQTVDEISETNFGYNAGIGAILNLGKNVDLKFETKYTSILKEGGSNSFIAPALGVDFRF